MKNRKDAGVEVGTDTGASAPEERLDWGFESKGYLRNVPGASNRFGARFAISVEQDDMKRADAEALEAAMVGDGLKLFTAMASKFGVKV